MRPTERGLVTPFVPRLCAAACAAVLAAALGCGANPVLTRFQETHNEAAAALQAAENAQNAPAYAQALRLYEEGETLEITGEPLQALYLFDRAIRYAELAAAQANEADADNKRQNALRKLIEALQNEGKLREEAAEARRKLEQALRERAENDARNAQNETAQTRAQSEIDLALALAQAAVEQAAYALDLAEQAGAARHEPEQLQNARQEAEEAARQLQRGNLDGAEEARACAMRALQEAERIRLSALGKETQRRAERRRSETDAAVEAARSLGAAAALRAAAREYQNWAAKPYETAQTALNEAQIRFQNGDYAQAQTAAENARQAALLALSEGKAAQLADRQKRSAEEQAALVTDAARLIPKRAEELPDLAKTVWSERIQLANDAAKFAQRLMEAGAVSLAARNAEAAVQTIADAESWARQVETDEAALFAAAKRIEGLNAAAAPNGVALLLSPEAFASDPQTEADKAARVLQQLSGRYRLAVSAHTEQADGVLEDEFRSLETARLLAQLIAETLGEQYAPAEAVGHGSAQPIENLPPGDPKQRRLEIAVRTRALPADPNAKNP